LTYWKLTKRLAGLDSSTEECDASLLENSSKDNMIPTNYINKGLMGKLV